MIALKYMVLYFGILAAVLKSTHAMSDEEREKIKEALMPSLLECGKQFNTDKETLKEAKEKDELDSIDKCFLACMFKKAGVMNDKGLFETDAAVDKFKKYLSSEEDVNNLTEIANTCAEVNTKSDSGDGCERAKLLFACFAEHKDKFHLN